MNRNHLVEKVIFFCGLATVTGLWLLLYAQPVHASRYEVGISTSANLLYMKEDDLSARLGDIRALGAVWLRVDFNWSFIQPDAPHEYQWEAYDRVVKQAAAHNLKILAMLGYTPHWAQEKQCASLTDKERANRCSPAHSWSFASFAKTAAERYKGTNVRAWEIWNEPNLRGYWQKADGNNLQADPSAYAALANSAALEIRSTYPDSVILTGGVAPLFEPHRAKGVRQSDFLAAVLPQLNTELFDGIAVHPYSWPLLPGKQAVYNAFYTVDNGKAAYNLRAVMQAAGWGDKEVWGTEFGASTEGLRPPGRSSRWYRPDHVTEDMQARIIGDGIREWFKKPNVGPLFVHADSDQWLEQRKNEGGFGLRRADGSQKPSYNAFVQAAEQVQAAETY